MPAEGNFGGGKDGDVALRQAAEHLVNGNGEAIEGRGFIGAAHQAGVDIAAVGEIEPGQSVVALIEFVQVPLGGAGIEVRQAFSSQGGSTGGEKQFHTFEQAAGVGGVAAGVEPEDSEGEGRVDGGLGLLLIDAEHGKSGAALADHAAGINGAEGAFEVHRVTEFRDGEPEKEAFEGAAQVLLVDGARGTAGGGRTMVMAFADFKF